LVACGQSRPDPYDAALTSALSCVEQQVPSGKKVSAIWAHSIVAACKAEFEGWSRSIVERGLHKRFDASDPKMMKAYNRVLQDHTELIQLRISDEISSGLPTL
jgi:hypothetical protein